MMTIFRCIALTLVMLASQVVPAFAADEIAYLSYADGFWQVFVMNSSGQDQRQVSTTPYDKVKLSWYPDGRHLLLNGSQGEIARLDTQTRQESRITLPFDGVADAVISPDGKQIAFSFSAAGVVDRNDLWLTNADGSGQVKLTNMQGLQHEPAWDPDGKSIYFLSGPVGPGKKNHDVFRLDLASKAMSQVSGGAVYHFDIAAGRSHSLLYSNNKTGNYEIWLNDQKNRLVQLTKDAALNTKPSWAADEKSFVFESNRGGVRNIWMMNIDSGVMQQLTTATVGARAPVWLAGKQGAN